MKTQTRTLPEWEKIDALDLSYLYDELQDRKRGPGWTIKQVNEGIESYKFFLKIRAKYPKMELIPTATIDKVWHSHILRTEFYARDCDNIFGRFIHHRPTFNKSTEELAHFKKKFRETQRLMFEEFGEQPEADGIGFCLDPSPSCCSHTVSC